MLLWRHKKNKISSKIYNIQFIQVIYCIYGWSEGLSGDNNAIFAVHYLLSTKGVLTLGTVALNRARARLSLILIYAMTIHYDM